MWIIISEMSVLLLALSITMIRVCRKNHYQFLITLICLLIVADVATAFLVVGLYYECTDWLHN